MSIFLFFSLKKVSIAIILQSTKDIIVKKPQSAGDERGKEEEKTLSPCCQAAFKAGCYAWHMTKKRRGWGSPFPSGSGCLVVSCSFYFSPMKAEQLLTASEVGDNMGTETKRLARLGFFCLFCFCYHCAVCSFACLFSVVFL